MSTYWAVWFDIVARLVPAAIVVGAHVATIGSIAALELLIGGEFIVVERLSVHVVQSFVHFVAKDHVILRPTAGTRSDAAVPLRISWASRMLFFVVTLQAMSNHKYEKFNQSTLKIRPRPHLPDSTWDSSCSLHTFCCKACAHFPSKWPSSDFWSNHFLLENQKANLPDNAAPSRYYASSCSCPKNRVQVHLWGPVLEGGRLFSGQWVILTERTLFKSLRPLVMHSLRKVRCWPSWYEPLTPLCRLVIPLSIGSFGLLSREVWMNLQLFLKWNKAILILEWARMNNFSKSTCHLGAKEPSKSSTLLGVQV